MRWRTGLRTLSSNLSSGPAVVSIVTDKSTRIIVVSVSTPSGVDASEFAAEEMGPHDILTRRRGGVLPPPRRPRPDTPPRFGAAPRATEHHCAGLRGEAIASADLGDERVKAFQDAHHLHRGPLAIAARRGSTSSRSPGLSDLGVWMRDDSSEHDPADDDGPGRVPVKPEHEWPPLTSPYDLGQRSRINLALTSQRACYAFRFQTATIR